MAALKFSVIASVVKSFSPLPWLLFEIFCGLVDSFPLFSRKVLVPVMDVGEMCVRMRQRFVNMSVRVWFVRVNARRVRVLMVLIVDVMMFVFMLFG